MSELNRPSRSFWPLQIAGLGLRYRLWPGAEDTALRGRNLSAVFRTLYRRVGQPCIKAALRCTHPAVRESMRKIRLPNFTQPPSLPKNSVKKPSLYPINSLKQNSATACPFFPGNSTPGIFFEVQFTHIHCNLAVFTGTPARAKVKGAGNSEKVRFGCRQTGWAWPNGRASWTR